MATYTIYLIRSQQAEMKVEADDPITALSMAKRAAPDADSKQWRDVGISAQTMPLRDVK